MPTLRPFWRSLRVAEHLLTGMMIALGIACGRRIGLRFPRLPDVVRWWHARLCRVLELRIEVKGEPVCNTLLVANHVSWLDVPVLGSQARIDFLSKAEIRDWPLIGWMAGIVGTLYIVRGGNQTGFLIPHIAERIRTKGQVALFPEGTTTDGTRLRRFHPRLLGVGQLEGVSVQPVALRYGTNASPDLVAPFVNDDALLAHLVRVVRHPGLRVQVSFLSPLDGRALSRRRIAEHCRRAIGGALGLETSDSLALPTVRDPAPPLSASPATVLLDAA